MKKIILFLLIILPALTFSQNLTGTWEGNSGVAYVKLVVIHQGDSLYGYTYDEKPGYCKATFAGTYKRDKNLVKGKGMEMLQNSGTHGLAVYSMSYSAAGSEEYLRGTVAAKGLLLQVLSMGMGSAIRLRKLTNDVDTIAYMRKKLAHATPVRAESSIPTVVTKPAADTVKLVPVIVKQEMPVLKVPAVTITDQKKKRVSKLVQSIYTNADTVKMFVYDNGEVDGDTVTIFLNNVVILDHYRISGKAKELYLAIPKNGGEQSIELFANNLGTIPPNTALIVIMAGKKRYELRTSYDLQTNAKIIIQYRE